MEQQDGQDHNDRRFSEVRKFEESEMEPKRLSEANRREIESDQHTVGGF